MRLPYSLLLIVFASCSAPQSVLAATHDFQDLFAQLDRNSDGWLEADEIDDNNARLFTRLLRTADANHDSRLSVAEFEQGLQPQRLAKPLPKKQGTKLPGTDALLLLIARMDVDGNRTIIAEEVPKEFQGFFKQVQTHIGGKQDGRVTQREITQVAPRLSQLALRFTKQHDIDVELEIALLPEKQMSMVERMDAPSRPGEMISDPEQAKEIFGRLDADGNGLVTTEEVPPPFADRFEQLLERADKNQDGQLSKKELLAFSRRMKAFEEQRPSQKEINDRLAKLIRQFDTNGDSLLNKKELPRRLKGRFDRLDADGDGTLDREELTRVVALPIPMRKPEVKSSDRKRSRKKS